MKKSFYIVFIIIFSFFVPFVVSAEGASLYFSPNIGTFFIGSTFNVSIFVNTGGNDINAVEVDLKFDPRKLQVASPVAGKSFISVWIAQPTYSNIEGTVSFQGGVPSPGINTSSGLVSTITFRVISPGETFIEFLDSSQVLLDDGKGTNILTSMGEGFYSLKIPPPAGPKVFSSTYTDQNKWYKNNNPAFAWQKETGVTDFSYSIDQNFHTVPDNISEGSHASVSYVDLEDGIWYFHIKAKKGGGWGGVTHYLVQIDTTPPAIFKLSFEPTPNSPVTAARAPVVSFITTDALSGLDHYEMKAVNLRKTVQNKEASFFVEVNSPYRLHNLDLGEYEIVVRAYDQAMNWQDASERIEIIPSTRLFYISKSGISIFTIFLSWWKAILFLVPLSIFIAINISRWWKSHKYIYKRMDVLDKVKTEWKKKEEELKRKIHKM
ncbi:MAG: cohesin domain-containing protein [Patescibacteria group bacterium]|nr:cohesin domain-containing protein [Patescibacteria group bacterium]